MTRMALASYTLACSIMIAGCGVIPASEETVTVEGPPIPTRLQMCPPLPQLSQEATRFERQVWALTIIALYEQCAKSKQ